MIASLKAIALIINVLSTGLCFTSHTGEDQHVITGVTQDKFITTVPYLSLNSSQDQAY